MEMAKLRKETPVTIKLFLPNNAISSGVLLPGFVFLNPAGDTHERWKLDCHRQERSSMATPK
jgi:hypothetical protein